eukprot:179435-Hanusia_phi.AAC.1
MHAEVFWMNLQLSQALINPDNPSVLYDVSTCGCKSTLQATEHVAILLEQPIMPSFGTPGCE